MQAVLSRKVKKLLNFESNSKNRLADDNKPAAPGGTDGANPADANTGEQVLYISTLLLVIIVGR